MKKMFKFILFILIFSVIWHYIFNIIWLEKNNISNFYLEERNSLDVIYIGGSNVQQSFNATLAYHLYGFTTGLVSTKAQPFVATQSLIEEVKKSQNPKLYIIDLARSHYNFSTTFNDAWTREVTDAMKPSKNRIDTINKLLKYSNADNNEYINYYFSFFKYHNAWKNINTNSFKNSEPYKGYAFWQDTLKVAPQERKKWSNGSKVLPFSNEQVILELVNYIEINNINVLFVVPVINSLSEDEQMQLNKIITILKNNKLKVINFNELEELKIDYKKDFYEPSHLNVYGATKYTIYFSKYLKENYYLQDHRKDEMYTSWNEEYENFKQVFKYWVKDDFENILSEYMS